MNAPTLDFKLERMVQGKVKLRMHEQNKYNHVHKYVQEGGNFHALCLKLECSERTARRMIAGYRSEGESFFIHGNRGKSPGSAIPDQVKKLIIATYQNPIYQGANIAHFHELLQRLHPEIPSVSLSSLRNIFKEADILSPKAHRHTKKEHRKKMKERDRIKNSSIHEELVEVTQKLGAPLEKEPHPSREKSRYAGELVFMDASPHPWFGEELPPCNLHAAIDDATGSVVGGYFNEQETLDGYYHVTAQILGGYGIPYRIQTDRRTVFEYVHLTKPSTEKDTATQFGYACKTLGIDLRTTSCAQHQGKIERLFGTFQSRLVIELRIAGITTIKGANEFLRSYLPQYNQQFAVPLDEYTKNAFETKPTKEEINKTLAVLSQRTVNAGSCIRYQNKTYRFIDENRNIVPIKRMTMVTVIKALDGNLYAACGESTFALRELLPHQPYSKELDLSVQTPPKKEKLYIPDMEHPWRKGKFAAYERQRWQEVYSFDEVCYTTERIYESDLNGSF